MPARASYRTYKVVKGDTLAAIARKFATTVPEIAVASGVADVNKIKVGQELTIPVATGYDPEDLDLSEVKVTAQARPLTSSAPKMDPRATSGEQALMNAANGLAEWLRPPKLYVTLAGAAVVLYALVGPKPRSKSNATRRRISR